MSNRRAGNESSWSVSRIGRRGPTRTVIVRRVIMVGPFPPPVHGMATANAAVCERIRSIGADVTVIDVSAPSLKRSFVSRVSRVPRIVFGLMQCAIECRGPHSLLYMSVSGGLGQIYEILFAVLARVAKVDICLHHHSFSYIESRRFITRFLCCVAGASCLHIVLSRSMERRLRGHYPIVRRSLVVSNTVLLMAHRGVTATPRARVKRIGFISNISREKGVYEFLSLAAACHASGLNVEWVLAGPFQDSETETCVLRIVRDGQIVKYVGAVYGEDKELFFAAIDVLIFPSCYANEAEPLSIHEAMMHGVPIIAYGRGSIPEIVGAVGGVVISPSEDFIPTAKATLARWISFPDDFLKTSSGAVRKFAETYESSLKNWETLQQEVLRL
jgi:glycosyltransferase involved in cell wall biosynthesis